MDFDLVSEITEIEIIVAGSGVRARVRLRKHYGKGRWRKLKGIASVRLPDGNDTVGGSPLVPGSRSGEERVQAKIAVPGLI